MILNAFHGVLHDMKDYRNIVFFAVFYVFFLQILGFLHFNHIYSYKSGVF